MNVVLQNLLKLQALEFGETDQKNTDAHIADLRTKIPQPILGHYDRLRARDKKGVAIVRNQSCSGCHMHVPIGTITVLMRGEDVQLCESCGRYLYWPDPAENQFLEHLEAAKPAAKPPVRRSKTAEGGRRRRALANAA
jgi:predicted  nucleic acid-binding Zn-ribbon protein